MVGEHAVDVGVELERFAAGDALLDVLVGFLGLLEVEFLAAFGKQDVHDACALATCTAEALQLRVI